MKNNKRFIHILSGPIIGAGVALVLPGIFSIQARIALGIMTLMLFWWITRPVHLAVTALIPLVINSIYEMIPMKSMLEDYFNPTVLLILGASILTATWTIQGLDRRVALKSLSSLGMSVNKQVAIFFMISLVMSAFMPNMVVVAALCPIAFSLVQFSGSGTDTKVSFVFLLSIAWGTGLGGFGTPMGGAMNLVVISNIEAFTGREFLYWQWVVNAFPYILILAGITLVYLLGIKKESKMLPGTKEHYTGQLSAIGKISQGEIYALVLFSAAVIISFARPLYKDVLPGLTPPYVFLIIGVLAFFIRTGNKKQLIDWKQADQKVNWGLMILFAGGIALGGLIVDTGAATALAGFISDSSNSAILPLIALASATGMFLANTSSNTAACAITIPLVVSVSQGLGINPILPVFITAAACNSAFVLPTSIRAVPVGFGLDSGYMFRKGIVINLLIYAALVISGYIAYMLMG
ncbi:MAG: anion permease [Clostridia bacterium]|nr:anion permease [Clostridia bacterium]